MLHKFSRYANTKCIIQLVITRFLQIFQNVRTLPHTVSSKTNVFLNLEIVPIQIVTAIFQFST